MGLPEPTHAQLSDRFVQFILTRGNPDGSSVYPHRLTDGSQAPDAVYLLRKTLAAQPAGSVVMIQVGNSANFAALLESRPDAISNLSGSDLIQRKVRFLSVMAGSFRDIKSPDGGFGINIFEDVASAEKIYNEWPTPIWQGIWVNRSGISGRRLRGLPSLSPDGQRGEDRSRRGIPDSDDLLRRFNAQPLSSPLGRYLSLLISRERWRGEVP